MDVRDCPFSFEGPWMKKQYRFHVYDLNRDNCISREEMFPMRKNSPIRQLTEEDLVQITLKKMDHDGRLSFADFGKAVREENLLLEAFGTCLPDTTSIEAFEQQVFQERPVLRKKITFKSIFIYEVFNKNVNSCLQCDAKMCKEKRAAKRKGLNGNFPR